jgi:hypothetical protein
MPRCAFAYTETEVGSSPAFPNGHKAHRPLVQLEIVNGSKSIACSAVVDSGADYCSFPSDFLPELGLEVVRLTGASWATCAAALGR